ncbi:MAG: putative Ig domain-containing protein [Puia sp.]|nr:putative Ig domain-containing protein [Puia sp.]
MLKIGVFISCFLSLILFFAPETGSAQDVSILQGWKFKTGDQAGWAAPAFSDSDWAPIKIGAPWEAQGYPGYNGFAWYRLHITIPSAIRDKSFLKDRIRFDLGKIDDGDEVYLNGSLIGRNGGRGGTIESGVWDQDRSYTLPLADSRIHWDQDNVIAVRVWDRNGDGGMYDGKYGISINDVTDYVRINTADNGFQFGNNKQVSKKISLQSVSPTYDFTGRLHISVADPISGSVVFKQTLGIDFAKDRPFEYTYKVSLPENKSYQATYTFEEGRSKKQLSVTEGIPFILTPRPPATPRINGADVFGTYPNAPFLYRVPATGEGPLTYKAASLPATLKLDPQTGIITGTLAAKGSYKVKLSVRNKLGSATKNFTIVCGDKIGLTPALGWNSWNCWGLTVSDEKVRASAKAMADRLASHGWSYINIDDGWENAQRDADGKILANSKFPDMKGLADFVHSLGLRMGIYSSPGPRTCGGYLGSYQHERQDAASYAAWGFDYLKYDWCSYGEIAPRDPSLEDYQKPYKVMQEALASTGRNIIYSLCQYGMGDVWKWGNQVGANSWRTTGDISDTWGSLSGIGFKQDHCAPYTEPGHFNDPDMLVVGRVGWGPSLHDTRLTPDEQYTHISLWSLLSAPMLIGCDMSRLDDFTLNLLTNDEVIAVDQDALAKPAVRVADQDGIQVWVKELRDGSRAVGLFNLNDKAHPARLDFETLKLPSGQKLKLRDCWRQQDLGVQKGSYSVTLPAHGVVLLRVKAAQ